MAKKSKLELYPSYKLEYQTNNSMLFNAIGEHISFLKLNHCFDNGVNLFTDLYIKFRIQDAVVSITDDLIRYGEYNKIEKKCFSIGTEHVDKNGLITTSYIEDEKGAFSAFSIEEPVRAAYFTKWILQLKPSIADRRIDLKCEGTPIERLEFCNEYLALITMARIFNLKRGANRSSYKSLFGEDSMETLLYSLRYRLVHQDSYSELYRNTFYNAIKRGYT